MDENLNKPKVSIIMLTYNRAKFIGTAIESILNQSFEDWELLIIDDGSRDNTDQIIKRYQNDQRIIYQKQADHSGISKNRNLALEKARGEYIAVLDSDDVWTDPEKLTKQLKFMIQNPDHVLLGSQFERIDQHGHTLNNVRVTLSDEKIRDQILLRNQFIHSGVLFRREPALRAGSYDEKLFIWEDLDLWLRLGLLGKLANLNESMVAYRKHSDSTSSLRKIKGALTILHIINKYGRNYPHFLLAYIKGTARIGVRMIGL